MQTKISTKDKVICLIDNHYPNQAVNPPIYQNSIFHFDTIDDYIAYKKRELKSYCYTRGNNPTTEVLEHKLAQLDQGETCRVFSSGMGAISATLFALLNSGDHVLVINDIYGPTKEYLQVLAKFNISFDVISSFDTKNLTSFIKDNTRIIYTESPATMTFNVVDLRYIAEVAKSRNIYTVIDNTCMTPLLQKPLALGFDVAVYSLSKYTGGHSDVLAGAVVTSNQLLAKIDKEGFKLGGSVISPNDAFLLLRGLRTLPSRLETLANITQEVVSYLQSNNKVNAVLHPLAYNEEDRKLYQSQTTGITSLLSIKLTTNNTTQIKKFIDSLKTFSIAVSWGGFENLVMVQDISEFSKPQSENIIIRLALGLLDASTIIADLEQAFNQIEVL
ncbi:MAG: aminotransferase class I/II-fold pyridoxal phosphate-dependent enzyme [Neisseriaceae bacterium]|nr:MAG: aminotransferase class I/II-fold pyridoxal phosphate-dependent enzyme [Neisseriaceae bacterium]